MKARDYKAIALLEKIAVDVEPVKSARIASALYIQGELIAVGVNKRRSDPFMKRFSKESEACEYLIHSEVATIKNALRRVKVDDLLNSTLYIARVKYTGSDKSAQTQCWGMSKPCKSCHAAILNFGIKRVVYTTDEQTLAELES